MNAIVTNALAAALDAAAGQLNSVASWPESSTGFAFWIFKQTGTPKPTFTNLPLRQTAGGGVEAHARACSIRLRH